MEKKLFINGRFYTVSGDNWHLKPAEALAVNGDGIITYVGKRAGFPEKNCQVIDLSGAAVLPGFVDAHVHIPGNSLTKLFEVDLFQAGTAEEIRNRIADFLERQPDARAVFGTGFDMGIIDDQGRAPCAQWLDDICGDRLAVLQSGDMHSRLLNTAAMKAAGILEAGYTYEGKGRIHTGSDGSPTGLLTDTWDIKLPEHTFTKEEICRAIKDFEQEMLKWGYTSIMAAAPFSKGLPAEILTYLKECETKMRINASILIRPEAAGERMEQLVSARDNMQQGDLRVTTAKYMIDGVLEGNTACLKEDYCNIKGFRGQPIWKYDALVQSFRQSIKNGFQIHAHTIGDAAVQMTLDAIEEAQKQEKNDKLRHVLTHLQLVDEKDFRRFGENNLIAAVQNFWHYKEPGFYENVELPALGKGRAERMYPLKSLKDSGAVITASGDYPVSPANNPLLGIQMGITRDAYEKTEQDIQGSSFVLNPAECVTLKDMIEAYTINGAYQLFREKETGSLEAGKHGDFVLLDRDPFETEPAELSKIRVLQTYLDGKELLKP